MKLYNFVIEQNGEVSSFNRTTVVQEAVLYKPSVKINGNGTKSVSVFVNEAEYTTGSYAETFCASLSKYVERLCSEA
jgi:hypothetical protein